MPVALPVWFWLCSFNLMLCFSLTVQLYEALVYNLIFLGRILPALGRGALSLPFRVAFNLSWALALWSMLHAHLANPGVVPASWEDFVQSIGRDIIIVRARHEYQPGKATFCARCHQTRPERAHHCQFCQKCVLRYDHHCPWISNCVGVNNHKFFLLAVIYSCLTSLVAVATTVPELFFCARALAWAQDDSLNAIVAAPVIAAFLVFGVVAFIAAVLLTILLTTYLPFAAKNLTAVEEGYTNMENPFDLGSARANLEQIFGSLGPDWLIPVRPCRPQTDGVFFPRAAERIGPGLMELCDHAVTRDSTDAPLVADAASRSASRAGKSTDYVVADWSISSEDEAAVRRLWRIRYLARPHVPVAAPQATKRRSWGACCTRVGPEV
mmetsp:Transcript_88674/g.264547  ORF Transcript_88674/g.264547 Transcript_88674/m.264547 type:complete len:382 (-) Transcript_88674:16-1161(-)